MYKKVKDTIEKHEMMKPGDKVLVCVSGGPDSIFLLKALNHLKSDLGITLCVANLDHGVRGAASRKDSGFVRKLCLESDLKFYHRRLKDASCANKKLSREENLREARYNFFKDMAAKAGANVIATGHTLDDNAETILMRIVKGTSLKGLAGIPPVRPNGKVTIVRPLIDLEKKRILDFLNKESFDYRLDHTNLDESFLRNKIRKKLLPYMTRYNPRVKITLSNMAESLRDDLEFIKEGLGVRKDIVKKKKTVFINLKDLVVQPKALQREILGDALKKCGGNIKRLNFNHWKEMHNFIRFKRRGQAMDLPGNVRITRKEKKLVFNQRNLKS